VKLYRFSPIDSYPDFFEALSYIHEAGNRLCFEALGEYLPVAENIGYFCHYESEYQLLSALRVDLTDPSVNFLGKYFLLNEPLSYASVNAIPAAEYKYIYVRGPDPYRAQVGDVDFVMNQEKFEALKQQLTADPLSNPHARIFPESRLDMIELHHPDIDVLSYIVSNTMTESIAQQ
jgi:hypothetical protein